MTELYSWTITELCSSLQPGKNKALPLFGIKWALLCENESFSTPRQN